MSSHPTPPPHDPAADDAAPTLSKEDARAGETSGHVRLILGLSMSLVVIGLGVLVFVWSSAA